MVGRWSGMVGKGKGQGRGWWWEGMGVGGVGGGGEVSGKWLEKKWQRR